MFLVLWPFVFSQFRNPPPGQGSGRSGAAEVYTGALLVQLAATGPAAVSCWGTFEQRP